MENQVSANPKDQLGIKSHQAVFITKVYNWMALALFITGLVAYFTATSPQIFNAIVGSKILFFGLIIGELEYGHRCVFGLFCAERPYHVGHFYGLYLKFNCNDILYYGRYLCCHEFLWLYNQKRFDKHREYGLYGIDRNHYCFCCQYVLAKRNDVLDHQLSWSSYFCGPYGL